jgi:predicted AAA+ superfamily ATPase
MEMIELWPLSKGEIDGTPDGFVDAIFHHGPMVKHHSDDDRRGYVERVARGGFPASLVREGKRRAQFPKCYVSDLINRDVI